MAVISFMGMGAMGSRMVKHLLSAGHQVCVWNRNISAAQVLVEAGATMAATPKEAAKGADYVISMLRDDRASQFAWCDEHDGALLTMSAGSIAIECSTLTVSWVKSLCQYCLEKQVALLDAPVAGSRPQAEAAQLIFLVGGTKKIYTQAQPLLAVMGSAVHYLGESGAGATVKLAVNTLLGTQLAVVAELIQLLDAQGVDVNQAVDTIAATPVCSPAVKVAAGAMLAENFNPLFPIELVEKDFSYAVQTAKDKQLSLPLTSAAWGVFQNAVKQGLGDANITAVAKLYD